MIEILECNGIDDSETFTGIKNLKNKEIIAKRKLISIASKIKIPEIVDYLILFQKDYFQEKAKYKKRRNFLNQLFKR